MFQKIISFIMSIIAFIMQLFGIGGSSKSEIKTFRDLSYGTDSAQVMDLFLPADNSASTGLIVYIHGGAWISGDKETNAETAESNAEDLGLAAASINYRLLGTGFDCDDMMDDITLAIGKAKETAEENGIKLTKVTLSGYSAGAHLALLYSYKYADVSPLPVACCIDCVGPADIADPAFYVNNDMGDELIYQIMGALAGVDLTPENFYDEDIQAALKAVSPVNFVTEASVPTLMIYGEVDTTVPYSNALSLDAALTAAGVTHDFFSCPNSGHSLENDDDVKQQYNAKLYEYADNYIY